MKIAIIGIGNVLLMDEGIGVHALNELKERYILPDCVNLIDGGTMGLDLLPFFEGNDRVLFIDAADFRTDPGIIKILRGEEIPRFLCSKLSVHQIGLPDMHCASALMGITPEDTRLIGIQPESVETGYGLTPRIQSKMEEIIAVVLSLLRDWGVHCEEKKTEHVSRNTL